VKVNKIVIVGGGSSGWMTASFLNKYLPNHDLTLIESANTPTIGVGESTIGHINYYMDSLGIKDKDWMEECNATYKTSIKFTNWTSDNRSFQYPFGKLDLSNNPGGIMEWFNLAAQDNKYKPEQFAQYYHNNFIMLDNNKLTKNEFNELPGFDFKYDTAYHMDATLFGQYLRKNHCDKVKHITDDVIEVTQDESGNVKFLKTKESGNIEADLFIDCTGFQSLLLGKTLGVPFISFEDQLINDMALATQIPYIDKEKEMEVFTNSTAIENGWVWNIPLWNRIGTGYVYSSKFVSDEQAEKEFREHLSSDNMVIGDKERAENAKIFKIKIKHGIHEKLWHKNVVGIGLSGGFIEPLESTGLMLTHETARYLTRVLTQRDSTVTAYDIKGFNIVVRETMEGFRSFIAMHYALSNRNDTPYWKHVTENIEYKQHDVYGQVKPDDIFKDVNVSLLMSSKLDEEIGGTMYILAGMGYSPLKEIDMFTIKNHHMKSDMVDRHKVTEQIFELKENQQTQLVDLMPTHYEFLSEEIYG